MYSRLLVAFIFLLGFIVIRSESATFKNQHNNPNRPFLFRGVNGGVNCATCTLVVGLVEQLGEIYNESVTQSFERLCLYLPSDFQQFCKAFGDALLPFIIERLDERETPDVICHAIGLCFTEAGKSECTIYPAPQGGVKARIERIVKRDTKLRFVGAGICDLPGIKELCDWIDSIFDKHDPAVDADKDFHSTSQTLRGVSWRGKDCDDSDPSIHPGALPVNADSLTDSNCNGIYGTDGATGTPYEDVLCKGSNSMGVAILGDSVGAHFHLPEEWFDATKISVEAFKDLAFIVENEIDWPEFSSTTGYKNSTYSVTRGPTKSVYNSMWQWNRCNHRDYQNIAVNGADSKNMLSKIIYSLARNPGTDKPLLLLYALIGNDVCNGHPDTFAHMTTPEEMRESFTKTLQYLDTHIPVGSHVIVNGLVDGRILYDNLHDRIHPIGRYRNDVTYKDLYTYLNCLEVSPCTGWLNANQTVRDMTTQRADALNAVLKNISETYQSSVFDLHYIDFPIKEAIKKWKATGGETWQLIEPVDGFHTNQYGQSLAGELIWDYIRTNLSEAIGPANPHNDQILSLFGDQGGYE